MDKVLALKRLVARVPGVRPLVRRLRGGRTYGPWQRSSTRHVPLGRAFSRGERPSMDAAALRTTFRASPLAAEVDTFVLYRILGNDLPPRHRDGQTRRNLAFLLKHEPELPGCEKRYIVNRIVDPREEDALLNLLERACASYLHIPFDPSEYHSISWDINGVPPEFAPWTRRFSLLSEERQLRVLMRLYRHKNNYVMNNNGARNAALEEGRSLAKWVLPWDGNCFITADAWREIVAAVRADAHLPYFLVPMARVTDNSQLFDPGFHPPAKEEPQLIFRRDARMAFDPEFFYGRRPKVELLWRLGVPGKWDQWGIEPWDLPCPPYADEAGMYGQAGWVARLSSGQPHLEQGMEYLVNHQRKTARNLAIQHLLDELDDAQACTMGTRSLVTDQHLSMLADGGLRARLRLAGDSVLIEGAWGALRVNGSSSGMLLRRFIDGTLQLTWRRASYKYTRAQRLFENAFVLALGYKQNRNSNCAHQAARLLREGFIDPKTALPVEQRRVSAIADMFSVCLLPETLRLLESDHVLDAKEICAIRRWLARYLDWLRHSEPGRKARSAPNSLGTCVDLQAVAIAADLGDTRLWRHTLRDSRLRLIQQFGESDANEGASLITANALDERCFNLQFWVQLARIAEVLGEDLWSCGGARGPYLRRAIDGVLSDADAGQGGHRFDPLRLHPLYHARVRAYGFEELAGSRPLLAADRIEAVFPPAYGIVPFWQLFHAHCEEPVERVTPMVAYG